MTNKPTARSTEIVILMEVCLNMSLSSYFWLKISEKALYLKKILETLFVCSVATIGDTAEAK